jgi:hypothetical protein
MLKEGRRSNVDKALKQSTKRKKTKKDDEAAADSDADIDDEPKRKRQRQDKDPATEVDDKDSPQPPQGLILQWILKQGRSKIDEAASKSTKRKGAKNGQEQRKANAKVPSFFIPGITSVVKARQNPKACFAAFFDIVALQNICQESSLNFGNRYVGNH